MGLTNEKKKKEIKRIRVPKIPGHFSNQKGKTIVARSRKRAQTRVRIKLQYPPQIVFHLLCVRRLGRRLCRHGWRNGLIRLRESILRPRWSRTAHRGILLTIGNLGRRERFARDSRRNARAGRRDFSSKRRGLAANRQRTTILRVGQWRVISIRKHRVILFIWKPMGTGSWRA